MKVSYLPMLLGLLIAEVSVGTSLASGTGIWPTWWSLPSCVSHLVLPCRTLSCEQGLCSNARESLESGKNLLSIPSPVINELSICNEHPEDQMFYLSNDFGNTVYRGGENIFGDTLQALTERRS